jgi:hypothetical protein
MDESCVPMIRANEALLFVWLTTEEAKRKGEAQKAVAQSLL